MRNMRNRVFHRQAGEKGRAEMRRREKARASKPAPGEIFEGEAKQVKLKVMMKVQV